MTKKSKAKAKEAKPEGSKIIEQCVIYVQCLAAYDAGFSVDRTGDADFCNTGDQIKKAHRAMCKLVGLSPNKTHGTAAITPLDRRELRADSTTYVSGASDSKTVRRKDRVSEFPPD